MGVTEISGFVFKEIGLLLHLRSDRKLSFRPALKFLCCMLISWLSSACKTFSKKEYSRNVQFELKREDCDWIGAEMQVKTRADSGRLSFEVRKAGERWTELTSVSGRLPGMSRNHRSESTRVTHRSEWLFTDTAAEYRACYEAKGQPKVCSQPRRISGCNLFIPEPEVRYSGDSLQILFADRWVNQPVHLRLNDANGSLLLQDTIMNNPTGRYSGRLPGSYTGKARLTMIWKNRILIREIQMDLAAQ